MRQNIGRRYIDCSCVMINGFFSFPFGKKSKAKVRIGEGVVFGDTQRVAEKRNTVFLVTALPPG